MATKAEIAKQVELEREAIRYGLRRLKETTQHLEGKTYASATVYGAASIKTLIPLLAAEITRTSHDRIKKGDNGRFLAEINKHLIGIEPEVAAAICLKITFDKVFSYKDSDRLLNEVVASIGAGLEGECQMRYYEQTDPRLLQNIQRRYWHSAVGTANKLKLTKILMRRKEILWDKWPRVAQVKLGGWLLDCLIRISSWFQKEITFHGPKKVLRLAPTETFLAIKDELMHNAELFSPCAWPMLIEPNDWSNDHAGGYLLNEVMRGHRMVRVRSDTDGLCKQGPKPIQFLNHLQKVPYRLNPFVVEVSEALFEQRIQVGKFLPLVELPLPPKPFDIADNAESRQSYRREAAETLNQNAAMFRKSCRTRSTMDLISRFKGVDRWFIPWSFDYRGRVYPIPAFLTPQDTDWGKSLLRFADESPMTPEVETWLAFQVATTYGLDKATIDERLQWVADNVSLISKVAMLPLDQREDWAAADEPWQFLAACEEYYACVIARTRSTTGLPVAVDATCSGLQILAGLARDKSTAQLVNVLPSDKPQDAYAAVAEAAKPHLPQRLADLLDRKVTKRTVMTIPYNAKEYSNRHYIKTALKDKEAEFNAEDVRTITKAVRAAMQEVVPGPMRVMEWVNEEIKLKLKDGIDQLNWVTPSGFRVKQYLMKPLLVTVKLQLLGLCKIQVADGDSHVIDTNRHKAATAPNLIHSLDASILHLAFLKFNEPFTVIHDSILCRATEMTRLNEVIRETYAEIFGKQDYLSEFARQINAVNSPPIVGDFSPEDVINSTYFFS
jgi:DNA-directed RNA polymerase